MDKTTLGFSVVIGAALGKGFFRSVETAGQRAARLGKQWAVTNKKLKATGDVIKYKKLLGELKAKQVALGGSSKQLERGIGEVQRRYRAARAEAKSYGIQIGQVVREHEKLQKELRQTETIQKRLTRKQGAAGRLRELRGKMLGVVGAGYGATRLFGAAMAREQQGLYLRTVINAKDGDREAAAIRARTQARAFARESLASEQELLEIEYALNSAGLEEETARAGGRMVHKLAKVTKGLPAQVGEIFGDVFNNMSGSLEGSMDENMQVIGNVLAKTQFKFAIRDFGQLGEGMKYIAASAASMKLPLEQTAAVIGQLNNSSLKGSQAGTAFEAVLKNLNKAADEIGFDVVRDEKGELDMLATLAQLKAELDGLETDARDRLLQEVFDTEGKRAIVPLIDKLDALKDSYQEVARAGQSNLVDEEYERFLESASGQWTTLKQNIGQVGVVFANTLLPVVGRLSSGAAIAAGWVSTLIERFPIIGKALGTIGVAFASVGAVMAGWTAGIWAVNAAMLANPIGLVIAGVAGLGAVLYTLLSRAEPVKTFLGGMWEGFMDGISPVLNAFGQVFGWLGSLAGGLAEATGGLGDFSNAGRLVGEVIGRSFGILGTIIGLLLRALAGLGTVLIGVGKLVGRALWFPFQAILKTVGLLFRGVAGLGKVIIGIGKLIGSALSVPLKAAAVPLKAIGSVVGFFKGGEDDEQAAPGKPKPTVSIKPVALAATVAAAPVAAQPVDVPLPAVPAPQARQVPHTDNRQHHDHSTHSYQLTIAQQPGEDAAALTERILTELEQRRQQSQREGLHDAL